MEPTGACGGWKCPGVCGKEPLGTWSKGPRIGGGNQREGYASSGKELLEDNGVRFTGSIRVFPSHVRLPRIGKIRPKEPTVKILTLLEERKAPSATISRGADRWYVSLACEVKRPDPVLRDGEP